MTPIHLLDSGASGWSHALIGATPSEAAELALDDIGPRQGKMRRNRWGSHRELTQVERGAERQKQRLERRSLRARVEQPAAVIALTAAPTAQILMGEGRAA